MAKPHFWEEPQQVVVRGTMTLWMRPRLYPNILSLPSLYNTKVVPQLDSFEIFSMHKDDIAKEGIPL